MDLMLPSFVDLGIGYDIARRHGAPIEVLALVQQIYHRAMYKYGNDAGSSHPAKLLQVFV